MKPHKILIVDDDPQRHTCDKKGPFNVGVRSGGRDGGTRRGRAPLLRNEDYLPSLILLDLKLPGMSGIDILRQIRADSRLSGITVIIVTNSLLESDKKESYASGANGFLNKAFDIDQFGRDIKSVLERWLKE